MKEYELTDNERGELSIFRLAKDKTTVSSKDIVLVTEKAAQKKLLEYLMGTCPHGRGDFGDSDKSVTQCFRHACGECMQSLLKDFGVS